MTQTLTATRCLVIHERNYAKRLLRNGELDEGEFEEMELRVNSTYKKLMNQGAVALDMPDELEIMGISELFSE